MGLERGAKSIQRLFTEKEGVFFLVHHFTVLRICVFWPLAAVCRVELSGHRAEFECKLLAAECSVTGVDSVFL